MSAVDRLYRAFRTCLCARTDSAVLTSFLAGFEWPCAERQLRPRRLAVVDRLEDVSISLSSSDQQVVLAALVEAADVLDWRQSYGAEELTPDFFDNYGWAEMFGTRGHFECETMAGGFLMLGPNAQYPDHHHAAEEIYIPLTANSLWSKDGSAFGLRARGELIHHPSEIRHAMRTTVEPLVALYLWRRGPLAQKPIIVERGKI